VTAALNIRTYTRLGELMHVLGDTCWCEPAVTRLRGTTVVEHSGGVQPTVKRQLAVIDSSQFPRRTGMPTEQPQTLHGLTRIARHTHRNH
jgi:hypothetical protein